MTGVTTAADSTLARFRVGWGDLDANNHMANVAILNRAADCRLLYFADHGFPGTRFVTERLGPVVSRDQLLYRKELRLMEEYTVDLRCAGLSVDGVRFSLENTFRDAAGETTAVVATDGVWFDLDARKPRTPPADLDALQRAIPRTAGFREIPARGH